MHRLLVILYLPLLANAASPLPSLSGFIDQHCVECHDSDVKKGGLDITSLTWKPEERKNFDEWVKIFDRVSKGDMPPAKKKERPEPAQQQTFLAALEQPLHDYQSQQQGQSGRTILRRLNRIEYERTLHDLLGITTPLIGILPEDTPMHGFDTVAEGLRFSQLQMEKFLEAADVAINDAINLEVQPEQVKKKFFFKDEQSTRKQLDTPVGTVTDKFNPKQKHRHTLKELPDAIVFFNEGYPPAELRQVNLRAGTYRFRISGYAHQSEGKAIAMRVYGDNFREKRLLGWFEMPADKPREVVITAALKNNEHLLIQPTDCGTDKNGKNVYNVDVKEFTGSGLAMQWVEVEGPLAESWPPSSVKKLFGDTPVTALDPKQRKYSRNKQVGYEIKPADAKASARSLIESFATRAFRRPLEAGEADRFVKLVTNELDAGVEFVDAMRVGFRGVLTAPQFLLFEEQPGKLDRYALASRLSYFLGSTMPDAELLAADLTEPEVMRAQVERLLKHENAAAFVTHFTGQWLELRKIDATTPDKKLYPEFDELLQLSMVAETQAFFTEVLNKNLPVTSFIQSDFAMLNRRMAEHYGIAEVKGEEFRRVSLAPDSPRGGVLTQASVLKVTANGTTTSPVVRGAWVMKRILGTPPPPPPAAVGSIEPDTRGSTTIREQLAKHRDAETCAACHANIDPPGFALESFDVIGGYRERYRSQEKGDRVDKRTPGGRYYRYMLGLPVDASGELPDGRKFTGIADFKKLLLDQQEQVIRSLTEKLVTYSTGAGITFADRRDIDAIAKKTKANGGGLHDLIHAITQSAIFQNK